MRFKHFPPLSNSGLLQVGPYISNVLSYLNISRCIFQLGTLGLIEIKGIPTQDIINMDKTGAGEMVESRPTNSSSTSAGDQYLP